MAKRFKVQNGALEIYDTILQLNDYVLPLKKLWYKEKELQAGAIRLFNIDEPGNTHKAIKPVMLSDSVGPYGVTFTADTFRVFAEQNLARSSATGPGQLAPLIIAKLSTVESETTLAVTGAIDDTTINVTDGTGFVIGKYLSLYNVTANRFYVGYITEVATNIISLDTPLDFAFPAGTFVTGGETNMAVDGSVTPKVFALRNTEQVIGTSAHLARIIFKGITASLGVFTEFGDLPALAKGIVLRKKDGVFRNILNAKSNEQMKELMYDFEIIAGTGPQDPDGFSGRFTFTKLGPFVELAPGEDLQLIIQDDLTGLTELEMMVEGHLKDW